MPGLPWTVAAVPVLLSAAIAVPLHDAPTPRDTCGYENCPAYEADVLNVHIVAHTHDDVGWLKTVDQYYYGSRNNIQKAGVQYILDSVVKELWADPKRKFIYVETAFFWKWWVRQPESVQYKVRTLVREGRLQFVGGAWSMNDEAAAHYHSTIDQFTWGLSKINETFGPCALPRTGWQIDPFGHAREFASLVAGMGYDGLFLGRIDYQDKRVRYRDRTMETLWRGDDDLGKSSDIFTGVLYNTYSPPPGFCFDVLCSDEPIIDDPDSPMFNVDDKVRTFIEISRNMSKAYKTNNILVTMGEDFQYQDAAMWYQNLDKLIQYTNLKSAKEGLKIKLFYSTPNCYLNSVKQANPSLPTKQDDFFPYASDPHAYWTGYFTSRPTTKYFERRGNVYLQMSKQLQVFAALEAHNQYVINGLKSAMGIMQHHDAITGTEKQHVTADYERILDQAVEDSLLVPRQAFNKMMQGDATKPPLFEFHRCRLNESSCYASEHSNTFVVTLYNPVAWRVNVPVRVPVMEGTYEVYIPNDEVPPEATTEEHLIGENNELDPEILELLGSDPTQEKSYGDNLHKDLATRWKHILTNGLPKEEKVILLKKYLPAENCTHMKAPILNPEIKSALSDINEKRDSYSEQKQNQMSSCISAIGKALNLALTQTENIPQEVIKTLSDAGRLLCDTHYRESLSRRFAIINAISKQKRDIIKNTKIDEHLFGTNLSEHLKSSKTISMSASELRFNSGKFIQLRSQPSTSARNRVALNARGAPRPPAVAETRVYPDQYRHPAPPPAPTRAPAPPRDYRRAPPPASTLRSRSYPQTRRR